MAEEDVYGVPQTIPTNFDFLQPQVFGAPEPVTPDEDPEPGSGDSGSQPDPGLGPNNPLGDLEDKAPLPEFDPRFRDAFDGLLFVGKLQLSFSWMYHRFVIQTVDQETLLEVGQLVKKYDGTATELRAMLTAMAAACLVSVDGKPLPYPISSEQSLLSARYEWVKKLHPFVIDYIYSKFDELDATVKEVLEEMGKA